MAEAVKTGTTTAASATATQASQRMQDIIAGYTFMLPAIIVLGLFLVVPMVAALFFSFTDWNGVTPLTSAEPYEMVGFENYSRLLLQDGSRQEAFFVALKNTIYFMLGVVPAQTILALVLAVIVNQRWLRFKGFFRTAFYFPSITSSVVISLIFMWLFTSNGIINQAISGLFPNYENITWLNDARGVFHNLLGLVGITRDSVGEWARTEFLSVRLWDWISGPSITMATIMILNTWTTIGTLMVVYLAALQNIPTQVYEAAVVDGASTWQIFRKITVPLLAPTTFFVVTLGLIGTLQVFDQVFVISSGGPADTTLTIAFLVYRSGFDDQRMGLAMATAIVLFILIFILTLVQRRITGSDKAQF
jgi:multiple sugar transport system permease protein